MSATESGSAGTGYVPSSPVFFRLIRRSMAVFVAVLCALAALVPAPLQEPADIGKVPNPAKAAWFLLWIQELVSYSRNLVYAVALVAAFLLALPYTRWGAADGPERSRRPVAALALALFSAIVILTVIAFFFRGPDWALTAGR